MRASRAALNKKRARWHTARVTPPPNDPFEVLYEDAWLLALCKPSGWAMHRTRGDVGPWVVDALEARFGEGLHTPHRLDRATSGALLVAKDVDTARALDAAFATGGVRKTYAALVRGRPPASGVVDHPVPKGRGEARVPAVTRFETVATGERFSLVACFPETGRFHQVRRHMKHLSHPLVGDVHYGKGDINRDFRARFGLHRLALHAASLALAHPMTGRALRVAAPIPQDMRGALDALGLTWPEGM